MDKAARVYVAGHTGLAGTGLMRALAERDVTGTITRSHAELDLEDAAATLRFFETQRPQIVFLAAAKVGGILANNSFPVDFLMRNLAIELNVLRAAHIVGVKRLVLLGSSCIYPRDCPQPIKEEYLLTGPLEPTNRPYALAKIAGVEMCWAYNRQCRTQWLAAMPTNLYGPGDSYDLTNAHVLPALIRKMHEGKLRGDDHVVIWGTGTPRREFLYSEDLGRALVHLAFLDDARYSQLTAPEHCPLINIGTGEDLTIMELARLVARVVGFHGRLILDASKPDGTMRKVMDVSRVRALGWLPTVGLTDGVRHAYEDFLLRTQLGTGAATAHGPDGAGRTLGQGHALASSLSKGECRGY